jgi:hypothetical protein
MKELKSKADIRIPNAMEISVASSFRIQWRWPFYRWDHVLTITPPLDAGTAVLITRHRVG